MNVDEFEDFIAAYTEDSNEDSGFANGSANVDANDL